MGILDDMEKDKIWNRMDDMKILGMTREDLDDDDGIIEELRKKDEILSKKEK
ncbi:hypothetical protein NE619_03825 [Anaerovorax odorimutans]|uniref:Uncharacterized protein n=1 Tax=Anaerovorax odorimutans TaxID=109327 RepID=A0ABT1RLM9_9FIRM|nr:hypothetical protein [Anaerovorax odorimutans]MCQ4635846.1 hypothetical protein [Anaerovorax odorimutans]